MNLTEISWRKVLIGGGSLAGIVGVLLGSAPVESMDCVYYLSDGQNINFLGEEALAKRNGYENFYLDGLNALLSYMGSDAVKTVAGESFKGVAFRTESGRITVLDCITYKEAGFLAYGRDVGWENDLTNRGVTNLGDNNIRARVEVVSQ